MSFRVCNQSSISYQSQRKRKKIRLISKPQSIYSSIKLCAPSHTMSIIKLENRNFFLRQSRDRSMVSQKQDFRVCMILSYILGRSLVDAIKPDKITMPWSRHYSCQIEQLRSLLVQTHSALWPGIRRLVNIILLKKSLLEKIGAWDSLEATKPLYTPFSHLLPRV